MAETSLTKQTELINRIESKGDFCLSDIPGISIKSKECLLKDGYIKIEKEIKVKGKTDSSIVSFDDFYLEIQEK